MPGVRCARSLAWKNKKPHELVHYGRAGITRHSRTRMVLTVSFVLSPVSRAFCHRRLQDHRLTSLISASGYQDHTTSPSACARIRLVRDKRPPHPLAQRS